MGSNLVRREHPPLPRGPFENWRLAASAGHHPTPSVPLCEHRHLPFCLLSRFHKRCSSEPTWLTVKLPRGWGWLGTVGCLAWVVLGFWVRDETQNPWAGESIQAALVGWLHLLYAPAVDLWACGLHRNCILDVSTQSKGFSLTRAVASDRGDGMKGDKEKSLLSI